MLGYIRSAEISLFCDPDFTSLGIGSRLLEELLLQLKRGKHRRSEAGHENQPLETQIGKVLAIMAVDDQAESGGLRLRDWYVNKWGFEQVGRLPGIGFKKDRS